jgi:hypothetical protein
MTATVVRPILNPSMRQFDRLHALKAHKIETKIFQNGNAATAITSAPKSAVYAPTLVVSVKVAHSQEPQ